MAFREVVMVCTMNSQIFNIRISEQNAQAKLQESLSSETRQHFEKINSHSKHHDDLE
jgi:hypothetical protein